MYTNIRPDYLKLVKILEEQAKFYNRIVTEERFFSTMFRVSYYGLGFENKTLINKTFVYRGSPLESTNVNNKLSILFIIYSLSL
jgi:hypothetical protein